MGKISILALASLVIALYAHADTFLEKISDEINAGEFTCVAVDADDCDAVYAGTMKGAYVTHDSGMTWRRIYSGTGDGQAVRAILARGGAVYLGTDEGLKVKSDSKQRWESAAGAASRVPVLSIAATGGEAPGLFVLTRDGLYISDPGMTTWMMAARQSGDVQADAEPAEEQPELPGMRCVWISGVSQQRIFLGTDSGVFYSDDGGRGFARFTSDGLISRDIVSLCGDSASDNGLCALTPSGIYNFDGRWEELDIPRGHGEVRFIARESGPGRRLLIATTQGVYRLKEDPAPGVDGSTLGAVQTEHEPGILKVQAAAVRYAEVHPGKISGWRTRANLCAVMPRVSFGLDSDRSRNAHWDSGANPDIWVWGPEDEDVGWDVTLSWDLSELVWNGAQTLIDVRSKLMVELRQDILSEVTGYYYERRRLKLELAVSPPEDPRAMMAKELRIEELTAHLDALTGGFFSKGSKSEARAAASFFE